MIHFLTIVLDGMPWIAMQANCLRQLKEPWTWHVVEGTAAPIDCTHWVQELPPRLSADGTTQFLNSLQDPRVRVRRHVRWAGKRAQLNAGLAGADLPGLLWQLDADEIWQPWQVSEVARLFRQHPDRNAAFFHCRYWLGPDIRVNSHGTWGGRSSHEWLRVWRYEPGQRFKSHEPPELEGPPLVPFRQKETEAAGLVFDHFAYALEAQVAFKQRYYHTKYADAVAQWRRLQNNHKWPVRLADWLGWITDEATATRTDHYAAPLRPKVSRAGGALKTNTGNGHLERPRKHILPRARATRARPANLHR